MIVLLLLGGSELELCILFKCGVLLSKLFRIVFKVVGIFDFYFGEGLFEEVFLVVAIMVTNFRGYMEGD